MPFWEGKVWTVSLGFGLDKTFYLSFVIHGLEITMASYITVMPIMSRETWSLSAFSVLKGLVHHTLAIGRLHIGIQSLSAVPMKLESWNMGPWIRWSWNGPCNTRYIGKGNWQYPFHDDLNSYLLSLCHLKREKWIPWATAKIYCWKHPGICWTV